MWQLYSLLKLQPNDKNTFKFGKGYHKFGFCMCAKKTKNHQKECFHLVRNGKRQHVRPVKAMFKPRKTIFIFWWEGGGENKKMLRMNTVHWTEKDTIIFSSHLCWQPALVNSASQQTSCVLSSVVFIEIISLFLFSLWVPEPRTYTKGPAFVKGIRASCKLTEVPTRVFTRSLQWNRQIRAKLPLWQWQCMRIVTKVWFLDIPRM